ncbi:hypothetical protein MRB53_034588 [Persea americana]|uniref:Uncharacterized protein n=1 Tax=Persea americana TaxID=3435 RepID=A0ACC2K2C0_PERAE|nr:hypothetical protein MRB53_034588 [Persea americana]
MPAKITAADEKRYARAFLFNLVSSQLCTNNASARGHAYILELFEDFDRYARGPACLASVYRSMTRATQIKDRLRTITGPLHLLMIPERSDELNQISDEQIENQPYLKWTELLDDIVDEKDRSIFHSTAPLIYYWIIHSHNADKVYWQFGVIQPVPPPFHRLQRFDERALTTVIDYRTRNKKFMEAWEATKTTVISGNPVKGNNRSREDYLNWFRHATRKSTLLSDEVDRKRVDNALKKATALTLNDLLFSLNLVFSIYGGLHLDLLGQSIPPMDSSSKWSSKILVNSFVLYKGRSLTATDSNQRPYHMETSSAFLDDAKETFKHKAPAKSPSGSAR